MKRPEPRCHAAPLEPPVVQCPYWQAVVNDWLWMIPTPGYCVAGPGGKVRVPAGATFARCCLTGRFTECPDFRGAPGREGRASRRGLDPEPRPPASLASRLPHAARESWRIQRPGQEEDPC
jgi:hypothetical protein